MTLHHYIQLPLLSGSPLEDTPSPAAKKDVKRPLCPVKTHSPKLTHSRNTPPLATNRGSTTLTPRKVRDGQMLLRMHKPLGDS